MKNLFPLLMLLCLSCNDSLDSQQNNKDSTISETQISIDSLANSITLQFHDFIQIDSSSYVLFPLAISVGEEKDRKIGSYINYESYDKDYGGYVKYWNIGFYDMVTKDFHLLSDSLKMIIHSFHASLNSELEKGKPKDSNFLYFEATTFDYNKDDKFNRDDPTYLFISDRSGKNFRQISPEFHHIEAWKLLENTNNIIMMAREDTNGNKLFEAEDNQIPFIFDLNNSQNATRIFDVNEMKQIKYQFLKNWKSQQ